MFGADNWIVDWSVNVNGRDMSADFRPYLLEIDVSDKAGESSDSCSLKLNDIDKLDFPAEGSEVAVGLMGYPVFTGILDDAKSSGTRGGGRIISVNAKGFDTRGKAKQAQNFNMDDATLGDFLQKSASNAGYSISVDPSVASKKRPVWSSDGEGFVDLGQRLAREYNATFKIRGTDAVFIPRGATLLGAVAGVVGRDGNVISWDISPYSGRGAFTKTKARWFDRKTGKFEEKEVEIKSDRPLPDSTNVVRGLAADEAQASDMTEGRKTEAEREGGGGSVEMDLTPWAQAEAMFTLTGARARVDGTYRIESVRHRASRSGGATTALELKQPKTS